MKNILLKGLFISASVTFVTSSASAMTCTNLTKALSKGSENSEVLKLQQFLFDGGYLTAKPNGYFGVGTVAAVKKFQGANGLSQAGSAGPATRSKIKEVSCGSMSVKTNVTQPASGNSKNTTLAVVDTTAKSSASVSNGFIITGEGINPSYGDGKIHVINGKMAYFIDKKIQGISKPVLVYDGVEVGFNDINSLIGTNGKIANITSKNGKSLLVYNGVQIENEYDTVSSLIEVNGKLAYVATNIEAKNSFVVYDGKKIGKTYSMLSSIHIKNINNKLAYTVNYSDGSSATAASKFVAFYDGAQVGTQYDAVKDLFDVNGKLLYYAVKNNQPITVYDGVEIGKGYDSVQIIDGKLLYTSTKDGKRVIVYNGKEYGSGYNLASTIILLNDKPAFVTLKDGKTFIVYDGVEIGKEYDGVSSPTSVNGKLAYIATKKDNESATGFKSFIVYNSKELGKEYDTVSSPTSVNGKLAYIATKNHKSFIVMEE